MNTRLQVLMLLAVVIIFIFLITQLSRHKIDLKYCFVWLFSLVAMVVLLAFPGLLQSISQVLGIVSPMNALFFICIAFLTCVCISLTVVVSKLSERIRTLTQNIAITEMEKINETAVHQSSI